MLQVLVVMVFHKYYWVTSKIKVCVCFYSVEENSTTDVCSQYIVFFSL